MKKEVSKSGTELEVLLKSNSQIRLITTSLLLSGEISTHLLTPFLLEEEILRKN